MSQLVEAFENAGFCASEYGFDAYDENSLFSRHVDFIKSPIEGRAAIELKIGWSWQFQAFPQVISTLLGSNYLGRGGITDLPPGYKDGTTLFTFNEDDEEFVSTQGLHWINAWFNLWTNTEWLLGLALHLNKNKSCIPPEAFIFAGFASNRNTRDYLFLSFCHSWNENYEKALIALRKHGVSEDLAEFEAALESRSTPFQSPAKLAKWVVRCSTTFLEPNANEQRRSVFDMAKQRIVSPNIALQPTGETLRVSPAAER